MNLASCIQKAGSALMDSDVQALKDMAAAYKERGFKAEDAEEAAVFDLLQIAQEQRQQLIDSLIEANIKVPDKYLQTEEAVVEREVAKQALTESITEAAPVDMTAPTTVEEAVDKEREQAEDLANLSSDEVRSMYAAGQLTKNRAEELFILATAREQREAAKAKAVEEATAAAVEQAATQPKSVSDIKLTTKGRARTAPAEPTAPAAPRKEGKLSLKKKPVEKPVEKPAAKKAPAKKVNATEAAIRHAEALKIPLESVVGTGKNGRVLIGDVDRAYERKRLEEESKAFVDAMNSTYTKAGLKRDNETLNDRARIRMSDEDFAGREDATDSLAAVEEVHGDNPVGANTILDLLEDSLTVTDIYRPLIAALRALGVGDVAVRFVSDKRIRQLNKGDSANGLFVHGTTTDGRPGRLVYINTEMLESPWVVKTILHELVHAVTVTKLTADNAAALKLDNLRQRAVDYLIENNLLTREDLEDNVGYGLTNVDEFVSEVLSNPIFQKTLAQIPATNKPGERKSLLQAFFDAVLNFLSLSPNHASMLTDVLALVPEVVATREEALRSIEAGPRTRIEAENIVFDEDRALWLMGDKTPTPTASDMELVRNVESMADRTTARQAARAINAFYGKTGRDPRALSRAGRRVSLGFHTTDQLVRRFSQLFQDGKENALRKWNEIATKKVERARTYQKRAEVLNKLWREFEKAHPEQAKKLSKLMIDATMADDHVDLAFFDTRNKHLWNLKNAQKRHLALKQEFNSLRPEGRKIYRMVREFFQEQRADIRRETLTHLANVEGGPATLGNAVFDQIRTAQTPEDISRIVLPPTIENPDEFRAALNNVVNQTSVPGPYFPLRRFGDYVVEAVRPHARLDGEYEKRKDAWAAAWGHREKDQTAKITTVKDKKTGKYYNVKSERMVMMFESYTEALNVAGDLAGKGFTGREGKELGVTKKIDWSFPPGSQAHVLLGQAKRKFDSDSPESKALDIAFLELLLDNSVRKSELQRRKVAGASTDMRRGFAERAFAGSWALADIETALESHDAMRKLKQPRTVEADEVRDEIILRNNRSLEERKVKAFDRVMSKTGFLWFLGSPSYTMVNLTQVPLVAMPYLQGKFGFNAQKHVFDSYKRLTAAAAKELHRARYGVRDSAENVLEVLKRQLNDDERAMVDELTTRGIIDATFVQELYEASKGVAPGKWGERVNTLMEIARTMPQTAEILNRVVVATAAYNAAKSKDGRHANAVEEAAEAVLQTQFDYSDHNKPRFFKQFSGARTIMMFKMYAQGMYALILSNFVKLKSKEDRREAATILGGLMASHSIAAGVLGGVFMEPVRLLVNLIAWSMDDDDDPWDLDRAVTQAVFELTGSQVATELITRGLPRGAGFDLSSRVGLNNIAVMGLDGYHRSGTDFFDSALISALGPMGGLLRNAMMGGDYWANGQYRKAIEKWTPKLVRDALKSYGIASEGLLDFNGNRILNPAKFGTADAVTQLIGFTPATTAKTYESRRAMKDYELAVKDSRKRLLMKWRNLPPSERAAFFREEVAPFNRRHPQSRITYDSLLRGREEQARREFGTQKGFYTKDMQIRKIGRAYNAD